MGKIIVVGSINTDMVIKAARIPKNGETVLGGTFSLFCGGKGANQAVAGARYGAEVFLVGKIGSDAFGIKAIEAVRTEKVKTEFLFQEDSSPTGIALITVDEYGENSIVVAPGANACLEKRDIDQLKSVISGASFVLLQLEIPMETVVYVIELANNYNVPVIMNPAPAPPAPLPRALLNKLFCITPNVPEASLITGVAIKDTKSAEKAARLIYDMGVKLVVITLGSSGVLLFDGDKVQLIPAKQVVAVDATAAGDTFNGVFAASMAEGNSPYEAAIEANRAAAISVTRMGAQTAAPYRNEILSEV